MASDPDKKWRIENAYGLEGLEFELRRYSPPSATDDHDHCAGCWAKFALFEDPNIQHDGYGTRREDAGKNCEIWVCRSCFADLKDGMRF